MQRKQQDNNAAELRWQQGQYADGVADGLAGRQAKFSNQHYQKGYRRGEARRLKRNSNVSR